MKGVLQYNTTQNKSSQSTVINFKFGARNKGVHEKEEVKIIRKKREWQYDRKAAGDLQG